MKQLKTAPKKQKGMTLIEMIVVLIIIIIIIAAAAGRIGGVFGKNEISEEVTNLNTLIVNTKTLRSAGGYGASGTNLVTTLIASDGVPKSMPVVAGAIKNAWDGTVTVTSTGAGFTVVAPSVPQPACIELANKVSRGGAVSTKVNATEAVTGEVSTIAATTSCSSPTANSLTFTVAN